MKGGIGDIMRQAQQVQENLQKTQEEIANAEVIGESGAGMVKVVTDSAVHLILSPSQEHLLKTTQKQKLQEAIKTRFGANVKLLISVEETPVETPAQQRQRQERESQQAAEQSMLKDPNVQTLEKMFDATLDKESIRPL